MKPKRRVWRHFRPAYIYREKFNGPRVARVHDLRGSWYSHRIVDGSMNLDTRTQCGVKRAYFLKVYRQVKVRLGASRLIPNLPSVTQRRATGIAHDEACELRGANPYSPDVVLITHRACGGGRERNREER